MTDEDKIKLIDLKNSILDYIDDYQMYPCTNQIESYIRYEFKELFNL